MFPLPLENKITGFFFYYCFLAFVGLVNMGNDNNFHCFKQQTYYEFTIYVVCRYQSHLHIIKYIIVNNLQYTNVTLMLTYLEIHISSIHPFIKTSKKSPTTSTKKLQ